MELQLQLQGNRTTVSGPAASERAAEPEEQMTYEVVPGSEPFGPVLVQQPLQQLPAGVGHIGLQNRSFVQDVAVHLGRVAAVERRLRESRTGSNGLHCIPADIKGLTGSLTSPYSIS